MRNSYLRPCETCGNPIDELQRGSCPHCGAELSEPTVSKFIAVNLMSGVALGLLVLCVVFRVLGS